MHLSKGKTVYITIDDGPLGGVRNAISAATKEAASISMFIVGLYYERSKQSSNFVDLVTEIPFVQVGNHSYSHANEYYHDQQGVIDDLNKNNKVLTLPTPPFYTRLPGRNVFRIPGLAKDDPYISAEENEIETIVNDAVYQNNFYLYG